MKGLEEATTLENFYQSANDWEQDPNTPENQDHSKALAQEVRTSVLNATQITGINIAQAKLDTLPDDIAGTFNTANNEIKVDRNIVMSDHRDHVLIHESWHAKNHQLSKGVSIDSAFEEGLTELASKETTHKTIAYDEEQKLVDKVALQVNTTREKLVLLFKEGQNEELNGYFQEYQMMT